MTEVEAFQSMVAHHRRLEEGLTARAAAVVAAAEGDGASYRQPVATLVAFMAEEVLPHARAEERTIYQVAATHPGRYGLVREMVAEHRALAAAVERLATVTDGPAAARQARQLATSFVAHVTKENDALLPPLLADDQVDLARVLEELHHLTERERQPLPMAGKVGRDPEDRLVTLLLDALSELARAGQGDRACQLAAAAWAALREARPDLAARATAGLHGLAREVPSSEPDVGAGVPGAGSPDADADLDVRALAPARRHEVIFESYERLVPGRSFVLVNDHDPKPLRYQFEVEHAGRFTWDVLEAGPSVWRVRIGRPARVGGRQLNGPPPRQSPSSPGPRASHQRRVGYSG